MSLFVSFVAALLGIPVFRDFLKDVAIGVASEVLVHPSTDPKFKEDYLALTSQLVAANTEEAKREILLKIRDLRKSPG